MEKIMKKCVEKLPNRSGVIVKGKILLKTEMRQICVP